MSLLLNAAGEILAAAPAVVDEFWRGYCWTQGIWPKSDDSAIAQLRLEIRGKELATGLWIVGQRLGWGVTLSGNLRENPSEVELIFHGRRKCDHPPFCPSAVSSVSSLPGEGPSASGTPGRFVYSLKTASHRFHVGPGELVVSD